MILVNKPRGATPLEALKKLKVDQPELAHEKLAYAGRLDPQAEGLMLVLVGDECKDQESYWKLDKEYEFRVLFGFSTDTGDIMGLVKDSQNDYFDVEELRSKLHTIEGKRSQKVPSFSSRPVNGKPLYAWAHDGEEVELPVNKINIYELELKGFERISKSDLLSFIHNNIAHVTGNFRQGIIIDRWEEMLKIINVDNFQVGSFRARVSSGTYIRTLAEEIGELVELPALALSIKRTRIGDYATI